MRCHLFNCFLLENETYILIHSAANFVLLLTQCISRSLRDPTQQENRENTDAYDGPNAMGSNTSCNEAATEERAVGDSENNVEINFTEKKLLVTMLEVLSISWISIKRKFDKVLFSCYIQLWCFLVVADYSFPLPNI